MVEGFLGNTEPPPLEVVPLYPNREGGLSLVDEGAVGRLPGAPVVAFIVVVELTTETGLSSLDSEIRATVPAVTGAFSLGLAIFDPNPNIAFGGPATVAAFEGRGLCTPCRAGLCTGLCAGGGGSGGRVVDIEGRGALTAEVPMVDEVRSRG